MAEKRDRLAVTDDQADIVERALFSVASVNADNRQQGLARRRRAA
jgi:hypothetical protein